MRRTDFSSQHVGAVLHRQEVTTLADRRFPFMLQFSLRNLLIAVVCCAFGVAALVNANVWWVAITWGTALFSVTAAALLAMHRREEKRAFWGGFALFGGLYLLLLMYSIQPVSSSNSSVLCLE